jgi:hypothetical protein
VSVTHSLMAAFAEARTQYPQIEKVWLGASYSWGCRMPNSLLMMSVNDAGRLDVVIRSMEDEFDVDDPNQHEALRLLTMLSSQWISTGYEVLRVLRERNLFPSAELPGLEHDFGLVCVTLQWHEIALDKKLSGPVDMTRVGPGDPSSHTYDPKGIRRGLSARHSVTWHVTDGRSLESRWVERLALSDRFLSLVTGRPIGQF